METISWGHKNWIQFLINPLLWLCVLITSQNDFLLEDLLNSSPVKFRLINTSCCNRSPHMPNEKMIVYQHATNTTEDLKRKNETCQRKALLKWVEARYILVFSQWLFQYGVCSIYHIQRMWNPFPPLYMTFCLIMLRNYLLWQTNQHNNNFRYSLGQN